MPVHVLASDVDQQKAAPLGLFILILLGVACYFLFKSMSGHLRRVRDDFPAAGFAPTDGPGANTGLTSHAGSTPEIVTDVDGLTRPAPVTLTRGSASEPRLIEPRVFEPPMIEPKVPEPRVVEADVTGPNESSPT